MSEHLYALGVLYFLIQILALQGTAVFVCSLPKPFFLSDLPYLHWAAESADRIVWSPHVLSE